MSQLTFTAFTNVAWWASTCSTICYIVGNTKSIVQTRETFARRQTWILITKGYERKYPLVSLRLRKLPDVTPLHLWFELCPVSAWIPFKTSGDVLLALWISSPSKKIEYRNIPDSSTFQNWFTVRFKNFPHRLKKHERFWPLVENGLSKKLGTCLQKEESLCAESFWTPRYRTLFRSVKIYLNKLQIEPLVLWYIFFSFIGNQTIYGVDKF